MSLYPEDDDYQKPHQYYCFHCGHNAIYSIVVNKYVEKRNEFVAEPWCVRCVYRHGMGDCKICNKSEPSLLFP